MSEFDNSLFVLTGIMSVARDGFAVCDAGLKVMSAESGLPTVFGEADIDYLHISDEHGVLADPAKSAAPEPEASNWCPGIAIRPATCTTGTSVLRGDRVECLWPGQRARPQSWPRPRGDMRIAIFESRCCRSFGLLAEVTKP